MPDIFYGITANYLRYLFLLEIFYDVNQTKLTVGSSWIAVVL